VVRGSLAIVGGIDQPRIIFSYSGNIDFKSGDTDALLIKSTLGQIKETIEFAQRFLHHKSEMANYPHLRRKIAEVHYVLSSPWIVSEAKLLSKRFEKETEITQKYVCDLIAEDREKLGSSTTEPLQVIEQKIFDVRLNSYSLTDWEHKSTKALDVSFTVSVAGAKMVENFINLSSHIVRPSKVHFHSSLLLQYIGIENVLEPGQNYCLVHIHGDETDVSVVRQKACIFFGSYSFGVRTVVDKISQISNLGRQATDSLVVLYTGGKLDDGENKKNIESIQTVAVQWYDELKKVLAVPNLEIKAPMSVIVTAWAHDDFFVKVLKDSIPGVPVYILSIDDLSNRISFEGQSEKRRLTALHAIAIHSLVE
jgi:cell division ATPase FtsA